MDPKNRNQEDSNLPQEEKAALKELIRLQKDRIITIKAADKGAGIVLVNYKDYMKTCYDHLLSKVQNQTGEPQMYYKAVNEFALEDAKEKIIVTLKEALDDGIITQSDYKAMNPEDRNAAKFYCNYKVHKAHDSIPPERPIISGSGSITENISIYVDHHKKHIATQHQSYLQDTPHILRIIEKVNQGPKLPLNAILVTTDAIGLYLNIPQEDGSSCLEEALNERQDQSVPSSFIVKLMNLIQKYNIFEFHDGQLWKQLIGVAMGTHPAPPFADIYLARRIDEQIRILAQKYGRDGKSSIMIMKRFLDDILKIFRGTTKELHMLLDDMNKIHPTLKFTMTHTTVESEEDIDKCDCQYTPSIPFLDTSLSIKEGKIVVDLYRKETSRKQYLLPSSCHPKVTTLAIPFSLGLRIVRTCTKPETRDIRLEDLKQLLLARKYPEDLVNKAINKARKIPR